MKQIVLTSVFLIAATLGMAMRPIPESLTDSLLEQSAQGMDTTVGEHIMNRLTEIGSSYAYTQPDSALFYFRKGLQIAQASGNRKQEAHFYLRIGGSHYVTGEYDFALESFLKGLEISQDINDSLGIATGLNNVAIIYVMSNKEKQAIEHHRQSIGICRKLGDTVLWSRNLENIGRNFDNLGQFDSALVYADSAISIYPTGKHRHGIFKIFVFKGWLYHNMGDYRKAEAEFLHVIRDTSYENKWEISYAMHGLASVYQKTGEYPLSIDYGLQSLKLAEEVNALWDLQQITHLLAGSYARLENFRQAYHYHTLHKTYSDSLFNEAKGKEINFLQLQHQEDENEKLLRENSLKQQRIDYKNIQIIAYTALLLLLVGLVIILYQQIVRKNFINRKLQEKNRIVAETNQELTQLNATKDIMLRILAHDLKSPVSTMISFTELLLEEFDQFSEQEIRRIISNLNRTAVEGLYLLENLLIWARSQTGKLAFNPKEANLYQLAQEAINLMASRAESKQISIDLDIPREFTAYADPMMTAAIFRNLLSNAIKFTDKGGVVTLSAEPAEGMVRVSVADTGRGIEQEEMAKLFDPSLLYTTTGTANEKGSGIGLILCKDFIQKQGGTIQVVSEKGNGSLFHFTIPIKPDFRE